MPANAEPRAKPRQPLSEAPPAELALPADVAVIYRQLARDLIQEGYASQVDARTVALTARIEVEVNRLTASIDADTVTTARGVIKPNPLLAELRASRTQLEKLYGALFMTPRARSACRVTEAQIRQATASAIPTRDRSASSPPVAASEPATDTVAGRVPTRRRD